MVGSAKTAGHSAFLAGNEAAADLPAWRGQPALGLFPPPGSNHRTQTVFDLKQRTEFNIEANAKLIVVGKATYSTTGFRNLQIFFADAILPEGVTYMGPFRQLLKRYRTYLFFQSIEQQYTTNSITQQQLWRTLFKMTIRTAAYVAGGLRMSKSVRFLSSLEHTQRHPEPRLDR